MKMNSLANGTSNDGVILLVAKVPTPGKCKTRLIPLLGDVGSATLAKAMLADVLLTLTHCEELNSVLKILLYAPGTPKGLEGMMNILEELKIGRQDEENNNGSFGWLLLPMESKVDLVSSDLGDLLEHALDRARHLTKKSVIFLGMDSPVIPLDDIHNAIMSPGEAFLCPADDGGYGMLSVPRHADSAKTFGHIPWSQSLTAMAQTKALTDQGISVKIGSLMHDIDEPDDVQRLCERIRNHNDESTKRNVLDRTSVGSKTILSYHSSLSHTKQALVSANLL